MGCAVYVRISDDKAGEALGVARQLSDCRALAERKGWPLIQDAYEDNDISATRKKGKRKERPAFQRLQADIKAGRVTSVVAWDFDRLFRDPLEQEQFFLLCELAGNVKVATIGDEVDIDTGDGLLVARIKGAVAAEEARKMGARIRRKHLELAQAGQDSGGGYRPFGYDADRVTVRPDEAQLIREAADRILAGGSLRGVVADWNRRGVPSVVGGPWRSASLKRVLTSGRICGWRAHHGELVALGTWPAIVDRPTVERLRGVLRDPARRMVRAPRSYLLTGGIARCGLCDRPLVARPRGDGRPCYVCASGPDFDGCGKIRRLSEPVEAWVADLLCRYLDTPAAAEAVRRVDDLDDTGELIAEVDRLEAKLKELAGDWAAERLSSASWHAARAAVEERMEAAARMLRQRDTHPVDATLIGNGVRLRDEWDGLGFDRRRAIVTQWIERVTVQPARKGYNRFDPVLIEVEWRK